MPTKTQTPAIPIDRDRPELPKLLMDRIPNGLGTLGEPWSTAIPYLAEARRKAIHDRSAYESLAGAGLAEARAADQVAAVEATKAGKPLPERTHEHAAIAAIEQAYAVAQVSSELANQSLHEIGWHLRTEAGAAAVEQIGERRLDALDQVAELAEAIGEKLGEAELLGGLAKIIQTTQDGRAHGVIPGGGPEQVEVNVHGQGVHGLAAAAALGVVAARERGES